MRNGFSLLILVCMLGACGYRTPLTLPKPDNTPAAPASTPGEKPGEKK